MEKVTSELGDNVYILPASMKRPESLAEYVSRVMQEEGISALKIEQRARKEAVSRGLEESHKISDASVGNLLLEKSANPTIFTLTALAWGLGRPIEEVVSVAFGLSVRDKAFGESELARIWELHQGLPAEDKKYFNRRIEDLLRDMQSAKRQKR